MALQLVSIIQCITSYHRLANTLEIVCKDEPRVFVDLVGPIT